MPGKLLANKIPGCDASAMLRSVWSCWLGYGGTNASSAATKDSHKGNSKDALGNWYRRMATLFIYS